MKASRSTSLARTIARVLGQHAAIATIAALAAHSTAHAQSTPASNSGGDIETVYVTGIRAGIEDAIELKRESTSIVEAISAEDIGKLPDTSIAESISRLPGLTSQRAEGRASAISLRGTDPGFTTALLNGREQVSTGDNRSIEFEQYPSELLSAVLVYKTPDAQLVGQGLAGTIDLRTTRPLAYGKRAMAFNMRGEMNSQDDLGADADDTGYRASFSYIDQFLDNTLGVTFGVARLVSPLAIQGAGTYEPWHPNTVPSDGFNFHEEIPVGVFVTNGMKVREDMGENKRDGAMAAIEWQPSDNFRSILDLYYTRRKQDDNARSLEVSLGNYPIDDVAFVNPVIVNNTLVAANLVNRVPLIRNFLFKTQDKIVAAGWNNEFSFGEWTITGDIGHSKAKRNEQQYEVNAQVFPNTTDSGYFSILPNDEMPTLSFNTNYADPARVRVGPTIYGSGYSKIPRVTDELSSIRVDVARPLGWWFSDGIAGVNYTDREKDKFQPEGPLLTRGDTYHQIDSEHLLAPMNLNYAGAGRALAWDVPGVLGAYYQPIAYGTPTSPGFDYLIGKNWTVEEKVMTAFVKANLDHEISSAITLKGNIGLQFVETDQSSDALTKAAPPNGGTARVVPFSDGKKFSDVLPAINLAFLLPAEQAVRVGIAKELARARMDQLKASSEFSFSPNGEPSGSGGNPRLDPWRANAFDVSYEKYFGPNAYVSLAGFYKDLKTYIYSQRTSGFDFSEYIGSLPPGTLAPGFTPQTTGFFSRPVNGEGGNLKGLEFSVSLSGGMFADFLEGFGTILSISETRSSITIEDPPGSDFIAGNNLGTIPLPGLSETVWNATVYYERAGFSARVATRARSEYIGEVTNFANDRSLKYVKGDQITDAQVGYEFGAGRLEGLSIVFQVNNLTNEPYIAYAVTETRQQDYQEYGRQYLLGVNYRL
jgi:iron complex outermembrane receptor protein